MEKNNKSKNIDLSLTMQQKFNFDSKKIEDELTVEKKLYKKRNEVLNLKRKLIEAERKKNKNKGIILILAFLNLILLVALLVFYYIHIHYEPKVVIKKERIVDENIVFLGDSITNRYDLSKYYKDKHIVNSGIEGNKTCDILNNMEERVYRYNPSKVVLLIGTNDLDKEVGETIEEVYTNIVTITKNIEEKRPLAKIYIESIYPINNNIQNSAAKNKDNATIDKINTRLKKLCQKEGYTYINIYDRLLDNDGYLNRNFTYDGLHINDAGYEIVTEEIRKTL